MQEQSAVDASSIDNASIPYVGQWNDLVSTTNWDKGRIICNWREALIADGAPASEYSDDAWARRVGGVSGQHVGRLRRVYQRFADDARDYLGLYWSHFQAALDWNDAEMWLEGAVQSDWSVSNMRGARWETLGAPEELKPKDEDIIVAELDEDVNPRLDQQGDPGETETLATTTARVRGAEADATAADGKETDHDDADQDPADSVAKSKSGSATDAEPKNERQPPFRPFENLPQLPDDLADALEGFKLAIVSHKLAGWREVSLEDVLAALDALRALAQAPAEA